MIPSSKPPSESPADVSDTSENRCGEGLDARDESEVPGDLREDQSVEEAGDATEDPADEEGDGDDPVDVHAHHASGVDVLGDGPDAPTGAGRAHEVVEEHEHARRRRALQAPGGC